MKKLIFLNLPNNLFAFLTNLYFFLNLVLITVYFMPITISFSFAYKKHMILTAIIVVLMLITVYFKLKIYFDFKKIGFFNIVINILLNILIFILIMYTPYLTLFFGAFYIFIDCFIFIGKYLGENHNVLKWCLSIIYLFIIFSLVSLLCMFLYVEIVGIKIIYNFFYFY